MGPIGNQLRGIGKPSDFLTAEALDDLQEQLNAILKTQTASAGLANASLSIQNLIGVLDGVNTVFSVVPLPSPARPPSAANTAVFRNGVMQDSADCTIAGGVITFQAFSIPLATDKVWAILWP